MIPSAAIDLIVTNEYRYDRTPDGGVWTQTEGQYSFWRRYLDVFERVRVLARIRDVPAVPPDFKRADGKRVKFVGIPYYLGPWQYFLNARKVKRVLRRAFRATDAVIFRGPGQVSFCLEPLLRKSDYPYGVEVTGDPFDIFAPGAVRHPLRSFLRWWFPRKVRRICASAMGAAYVTGHALQRRYPCDSNMFAISDVELTEDSYAQQAKVLDTGKGMVTLISVGSMAQIYKGQDLLIDAVAYCVRMGMELRLTLLGDGRHRPELEARAAAADLGDRARFLGQLPAGEAVRSQLDQSDLFVMSSRAEGLPRVMVEAMARGLPCIGSTVGGILELLPPEDLVSPGDAVALARKIQEVATDPARLARMSARNLKKAREFRTENLRSRRITFFEQILAATKSWQSREGSGNS